MGYLQTLKKLLGIGKRPVQQSSQSVLVHYDRLMRENDQLTEENETRLEERRKRKKARRDRESNDP